MDSLVIEGGRRLAGEVVISGAKNAALPILMATILAPGEHRLERVPMLRDIETTLQLLEALGARVQERGPVVRMDTSEVISVEAPYDLVKTMRASALVIGPLLARFGNARVSLPGGCAIGARPIDQHLKGLEALGAEVRLEQGYVEVRARRLRGSRLRFDTPTVGGTENLLMAAATAEGETVLENAAREPEIVDLATMLSGMGARIQGAGSGTIHVQGVSQLMPHPHSLIPDRIETGTYLAASAITGGDVTVRGTCPGHLDAVLCKLREAGAKVEVAGDAIRLVGPARPQPVTFTTGPHPGFPTDMQAQMMALLSIADGSSAITETIFENRFMHASELNRMGARISVDGNNATVRGVDQLSGAPVMATDLRASASLVLAGLVASGTTTVQRIYHLDRGYEALEKKLGNLGASIRRQPA